ncbi:unnamed protein product [Moneuplotes crassus]|uniref:Uncharacterized protein n=1 Tax=Euplotes crassus TaxID=5936 RepID=A0AAD1UMP6_EUPCR|nr:unnamed protein product [Moneuplotes crassus]
MQTGKVVNIRYNKPPLAKRRNIYKRELMSFIDEDVFQKSYDLVATKYALKKPKRNKKNGTSVNSASSRRKTKVTAPSLHSYEASSMKSINDAQYRAERLCSPILAKLERKKEQISEERWSPIKLKTPSLAKTSIFHNLSKDLYSGMFSTMESSEGVMLRCSQPLVNMAKNKAQLREDHSIISKLISGNNQNTETIKPKQVNKIRSVNKIWANFNNTKKLVKKFKKPLDLFNARLRKRKNQKSSVLKPRIISIMKLETLKEKAALRDKS